MSVKITGTSKFQSFEGGFWSIISDSGEELRPQMMPVQFQEENVKVQCRIEYLEEDFGFHMWGKMVRIVSFKTVGT